MAIQYWIANVPGTTVSSSEAERLAVIARNLGDTDESAIIGALGEITASAAEISNKCDGSGSYVALTSTGMAAAYSLLAANTGKVHLIPGTTANCTISTPTAADGLNFKLIVNNSSAEEGQNILITSNAAANYFKGNLNFNDIDGDAVGPIYSNTTANDSLLTITTPGGGTMVDLLCDGTNWYVWGIVTSDTAPAFSAT